jgi:hypothetical protein
LDAKIDNVGKEKGKIKRETEVRNLDEEDESGMKQKLGCVAVMLCSMSLCCIPIPLPS